MVYTIKLFVNSVVCMLIFSAGARGQSNAGLAQSTVGIHAGYTWPIGDWHAQRIVPSVSLFRGSVALNADIEIRLSDRLTLAFNGGYSGLDAGDWENYARSRGDNIRVTASLAHVGLLVRPHVKVGGPDVIKIEVGPVLLFQSASETFGGRSYEYDFFQSVRVGAQAGIEYDRVLNEALAVALRVAGFVAPSGVNYADGETRTVIALPVTVGLRFSL